MGVKQGDNLAPVLFLLVMQACLETFEANAPKLQFRFRADGVLTGRRGATGGATALKCTAFDFWTSL